MSSHETIASPSGSADNSLATVLLAEDNENEAFLFMRALRKLDFPGQVHHVEAGDEAIEWLTSLEANRRPSLVILDLKMPRVDGFEVLQWIRSEPRFQKLPTVILSSSDLPADSSRARQLGVDAYFCKPLTFPDYEQTIRAIFSQWLPVSPFQSAAG